MVFLEDAIDAGGAAKGDICIDHHEGHSSISFGWILASELADAIDFVMGEPMIARHKGVVFIDFAESGFPIVEFAGGDADPADEV